MHQAKNSYEVDEASHVFDSQGGVVPSNFPEERFTMATDIQVYFCDPPASGNTAKLTASPYGTVLQPTFALRGGTPPARPS
jgi:hypothetical protein